MLLGEILKSVTGDDGYPGDTATSRALARRRARARAGSSTRSRPSTATGRRSSTSTRSRRSCGRTARRTSSSPTARRGRWGRSASSASCPGWPGEEAFAAAADGQPRSARCSSATRRRRAGRERDASRSRATSRRSTRASAGARGSSASWSPSMSYAVPGLVLTDHELPVPLDHARPDGEQITIFAREVAEPEGRDEAVPRLPAGRARASRRSAPDRQPARARLPGPRAEGLPRAAARPARDGPLDAGHAAARAPTTCKHFRADSIVRDAELLREALGVERWSVLGQSFGGLCVVQRTSRSRPTGCARRSSPAACPAIGVPIDDVYRATWERMVERNRRYYARFPQDRERMLDARRAARAPRTCGCRAATG